MAFVTPLTSRLVRVSISYASFFRVIPFRWNKAGNLEPNYTGWNTIKWIIFAHQGFQTVSMGQVVLFSPDLPMICKVLQAAYYAQFLILCSIQLSFIRNGQDWINHYNQTAKFCGAIYQTYCAGAKVRAPWQAECELVLTVVAVFTIVQPLMIMIVLTLDPTFGVVVTSFFPYITYLPVTILMGCPINLILNLACWSCILAAMCIIIPFIYFTNFIVSELWANKSSPYTDDQLRAPDRVLYMYRTLGSIFNRLNTIVREFFLICVNNIVTFCAVMCNFTIIRFHSVFSVMFLVSLLIGAFTCPAFLVITYIKFGESNDRSRGLIESWKRNTEYRNPDERKLVSKYLASFRPVKVELGGFGYYRKVNTIRIVGKLIFYSAKFLLVTKNFF